MKKYIKPETTVIIISNEEVLDGGMGVFSQEAVDPMSKEHNTFWDNSFWGNSDEEEKPMFQQPKSLWD